MGVRRRPGGEATLKSYSDRAKGSWAKEAAKYRALHAGIDAATKKAFAERFASPDFCVFYDASTLIVSCAKPIGPFVVADCWLAAENLRVSACALGLGTCCIGSAIPALDSLEAKSELGISADVEAIAPIIVGVPSGPATEVPRRIRRSCIGSEPAEASGAPAATPSIDDLTGNWQLTPDERQSAMLAAFEPAGEF